MGRVNDGGIIVTEDVHTSYFKTFGYPSKYTFINWAKNIIDVINSRSENVETINNRYTHLISSLEFFESLVVFHIDRTLSVKSKSISNDGKTENLEDYRYQSEAINKAISIIDKAENRFYSSRKRTIRKRIILRILSSTRINILRIYNLKNLRKFRKLF
tara:strand:- start:279 stop:755 length:477 start_codon:yes stop_codon:yes gene_type:complete